VYETGLMRLLLIATTVVGVIGVLLPFAFIIGEAFFLRAGVHVRGSISAYYHTSMRDIFVGGLCVVGLLLATYMAEQRKRPDWWLSLLAGIAVLGVVFFPTGRPNLAEGAPLCGTTPEPRGCSPVQQQFGETRVAAIHFACAVVFILSLAAICFYFAYRERRAENTGLRNSSKPVDSSSSPRSCGSPSGAFCIGISGSSRRFTSAKSSRSGRSACHG
jgi:hypothetical protein